MKLFFSFVVFIVISSSVFSQKIIDTVPTPKGNMVIYENRTWEFLDDLNFNGVLNDYVYHHFLKDSLLNYHWPWDNSTCYSSNKTNDLSLMKDTLWLCVTEDSINNKFVMPFKGNITSRYGYRDGRYHNGIDIDLRKGDTVVAAFSGKVRYSKLNKHGFGNLVVIRHYNGLETFYAHMSELLVLPNQEVRAGEPIGLGGNTGHSYGSHLHFEVRFYDAPMNPEEIIDFKKQTIRNQNLFVHSRLFQQGAAPSHAYSSKMVGEAYHRIKSGQTLGYISRKYHTTVSQICRLNNIRSSTTLRIGRSLRVR